MQARMREPLDLVCEILRFEFACAACGEVGQHVACGQIAFAQCVITKMAGGVARKRRMRLVQHPALEADFVNGGCNVARRHAGRQAAPFGIQEVRLRDRLGDAGYQCVGALQVVILQRRFVDLRRKSDFVRTVGLHRVEMFGALGERRIEDVLSRIGRRIRVVPHRTAATGEHQRHGQEPPCLQSACEGRTHRQAV